MEGTAGPEIMRELARAFDAAFGKGKRKRILAERFEALLVA